MLKFRYSDDSKPPFWAVEKTFSIGRAQSNHLSIDDASVANVHAHIHNRGGTFLLKDAGSEFGTFVNGIRITQRNIDYGDKISFGGICIEVIDPYVNPSSLPHWSLIANSSWLNGQEFPLHFNETRSRITIGRSGECDIVIPGVHLSRTHAELSFIEDTLVLRDLGSINGSFVNDKIVQSAELKNGDKIRFDVYSFKVFGPSMKRPKTDTERLKKAKPQSKVEQNRAPEDKLWKTRATSPGNRREQDLYKNKSLPFIVAVILLCLFLGGSGYFLFGM